MSRAVFLPKFMKGTITHSLFFYTTISLISELIDLPFSYYREFVVEEKFGFNKQTLGLWLRDHILAFSLNTVIVNVVLSGLLKIFEIYGESFIIYTTGFLVVVSFAVQSLSPFIGRLFYKFTALQDENLKHQIENLASKFNFPKTNIFVIDGSTRSSHSNAYFVGLPWYKEIVIFDTLIEKQTTEGVVAVLGHELGHWKLNHIPKLMLIQLLDFTQIFGLFGVFIYNKSLYSSFGFTDNQPAIVGLVLYWIIKEPISTATRFVTNIFSRKFEYQADEFAKSLGYQDELSKSLLKLDINSSSVTNTDWLYSAYYNGHPLLSERLSALGYISKEKISRETKSKPLKED
ncbi:peptidase M48, Ste24p [Scheffersomyces stipitis CBS 6054]|uniref:CAAX prenyl protease n=1 Tax=Scheffersomyces stipitis (strain ATCC 58785 / CBS 6054 / NBRC 10063 / NRRL Y-11545) TaxID=322104 RepID=A3LZ45_PICST|nr:peptidase M48, Ste24p [Scheffersomyces stipitis CBS 6054]ABN68273.2 peptidase M48, Ste24p [Scheffersomyces stipitis CBS 6054]